MNETLLIKEVEGVLQRNYMDPDKFQKAINLIIQKITDAKIDCFIAPSKGGWIFTLICENICVSYYISTAENVIVKRVFTRARDLEIVDQHKLLSLN